MLCTKLKKKGRIDLYKYSWLLIFLLSMSFVAKSENLLDCFLDKGVFFKKNKNTYKIIFSDQLGFNVNSAKLTKIQKYKLSRINICLNKNKITHITIESHTDSTGRFETNESISGLRIAAISSFLQNTQANIKIKGLAFGEIRPIADNATARGRNKNRRTIIIIREKNNDHKRSPS